MAKGSVVNILEISPGDRLFFTGPFTEISKAHITLKNATFKNIIFKVCPNWIGVYTVNFFFWLYFEVMTTFY